MAGKKKVYPKRLKMAAIQDYYENGISLFGICEKYDITKHTIVEAGWKSIITM